MTAIKKPLERYVRESARSNPVLFQTLSAKSGVRQAKLAKDKEMKVLYRVRFNQPHWPRVMRESVREDSREAFTGEAMGWVLSGESGQSSRGRSRSVEEKATSFPRANGKRGTNLAPSETPCTWRRPLTGTWEISFTPGQARAGS